MSRVSVGNTIDWAERLKVCLMNTERVELFKLEVCIDRSEKRGTANKQRGG